MVRAGAHRTHAPAPTPKASAFFPVSAAEQPLIFRHGFAAMTAVAQALQLAMEEQAQISSMWDHMVDFCCLNTKVMTAALPAPWLAGQLSIAPFLPAVSWVCVQVMPGRRFAPL